MKTRTFLAGLFLITLVLRLCHSGVLWEPETFPLAAATQMWHGRALYRAIWYDKPPLAPLFYFLTGATAGWPLRVLGALYTWCASLIAYRFGRDYGGEVSGRWAAGLLAFFLLFDFPTSVLPLGPDLLMVLPHMAAVWLAWRGDALWAGVWAGVAFLLNVKGLFVLGACALFAGPATFWLLLGFAAPCAIAGAALVTTGAWDGYVAQVWVWGSAYAAGTFVTNPVWNGVVRSAHWMGFHLALVAGALRRTSWRFGAWLALSAAAVALGARFFPRYYLQLLPPLVILASAVRGRRAWIVAALLLVPLVRFAPRYAETAMGAPWSDTAMDRDSREASALFSGLAQPGDTLFIWGYRPEDWVYTRLPDATRFLDAQALTGVPADRHLTQSTPVMDGADARRELARSRPTFVLDGLTPFNPKLAPANYPELRAWFGHYHLVARTSTTIIYKRDSVPTEDDFLRANPGSR